MKTSTLTHILQSIFRVNPFKGSALPSRVFMFEKGQKCLPVPHLLNFKKPLQIFESFYVNANEENRAAKHNRFVYIPGLAPILHTRDPDLIKAILLASGDKPGQFDRDTEPTAGIARSTGVNTLLYANGAVWRRQKTMASRPFSKGSLYHPEEFHEFELTFRNTIKTRLEALNNLQTNNQDNKVRITLENEILPIMLELLVNNFFGGNVDYSELRQKYVPALISLIEHMIIDTVSPRLYSFYRRIKGKNAQIKQWNDAMEELTGIAMEGRKKGLGHWNAFHGQVEDEEALRSNIRVFLAGALEATSSFASWTITHLARNPVIQDKLYDELKDINVYNPDNLSNAKLLNYCLNETLRLTPSLYFFPRKATVDTWVEYGEDKKIMIPKGTTVRLDIWNANRCEEFWGEKVTGYPADEFSPMRWKVLEEKGLGPRHMMHFGFGHGARVCPGKFLGQLEVGLVVGGFIKLFRFNAVNETVGVRAGVTTKPDDGVLIDIEKR